MTQAVSALHEERPLPYPTSPSELERHRRAMDQDGYIVLRGVVPKEPLEQLRKALHEEFENVKRSGALFAGGGVLSGHLNCFPGEQSRFIYDAVAKAGVVDLVRELFPMATKNPNVGCNMNLPGSVAQHYHADGLYVEEFPIINITVVDTDLKNGAIDVLPGTHKTFHKFWKYAVDQLYKRTLRIPSKQGDVLVRTSNLWHRGMPNYTQVPRPMVALTWERGGKDVDGFKIHDGKIRFLPNWYKTDFMGQLRERTFVKVPLSYSAYRFAKSLMGDYGYASW